MITLFGSGPNFGLPDASPFVTKAETLLRMSKLPFEKALMSFSKAPKGKIPYIDDDGEMLGDSTFIRWHLEKKYGLNFDQGLTTEQRAIAWAFEKMAEDNLYWVSVHARWMDDANFKKGPRVFFKAAPAAIRPLVVAMIRRQVRKSLHGQGMGRHSAKEIAALGSRSVDAIADYLAEKPFFMGTEPTGGRHHLCVRHQRDVSSVRVAAAAGGSESRQPAALRRPHDGTLLSGAWRDCGLQGCGLR